MFDDEDEPNPLLKVGLGAALLGVLALLVKGLLLTFLGLFLGSFYDLARYASAESWPVYRGSVQEWGVRYAGDGAYSPRAEFFYDIDGEVYHGWRPTLDQPRYSSEQTARQSLASFPIGKEMRVSVNPLDATDAVLDPSSKDWKFLTLRLAVGCLLLGLVAAVLIGLEVPTYAVVLAICGLIALGGLGRVKSAGPAGRREGVSPAQLWESHAKLAEMRAAWASLKPGVLVGSAPAVGQPDKVMSSPGGPQTWIYDLDKGLEIPGKLMVLPSTSGWVVDRAYPPYTSMP